MNTAMQQLLEHFQYVRELDPYVQTILLEQRCKELIEVEKEQIMDAYKKGYIDGEYNATDITILNETFKSE